MIKRFARLTAVLTLLLTMALSAVPVYASGASISLSANKSTVANGSSVIIAIYVNGGGTPLNAVQVDLSFSSSKLQYVGYSSTGSAFEIGATSGGGDGTATIARGTTSPVSGSALVGTVTLRALSSSGSTVVSVASSSNLVNANDNTAVPYSSSGATVNFGVTAASPAATPAAPKDTTPPVITAVKATQLTPFSATITWTTNEPSDSVVEYGVDASYGLSASSATPTTAHSVALGSAFLTPQAVLHYHVKSTDGSGNVASGTDQTLQLPGISVTVIVRSPDGKPQAGALVTLDNASGTTDAHGSVTLPASLGNQKVTTVYQGVTVQKSITVSKSTKPLPPVQLDLARQPLNRWMMATVGLVVVVLVLLGLDAVLFGSHFFSRIAKLHPAPAAAAVPAVTPIMAKPPTPSKPKRQRHVPSLTGWLPKPRPKTKPQLTPPPAPTAAPEPVAKAEPTPVKPPEPPKAVDPPTAPLSESEAMQAVTKLMGGPPPDVTDLSGALSPVPPKPAAEQPGTPPTIQHFAPKPSAPLVIDVKAPEPDPLPVPKSVPKVEPVNAATPTDEVLAASPLQLTHTSKAAMVAHRLKKPASKKPVAQKASKPKTTKRKKAKA